MRNQNMRFKALSICMAGATALSLVAPMAANAATTEGDVLPISSNVATVAAHRAAETAPMILGANLTTTDSVKEVMQEVFGSNDNVNPNQFLYNYRTLDYAKFIENSAGDIIGITPTDTLVKLRSTVGPSVADLTGGSLATHSDIYLAAGYPDDVVSVAYNCNNLEEMVETMHDLADTINELGKDGLYKETPQEIADDFDDYVNLTRSNVEDAIAGGMDEKIVAIVSASSTSGEYIAYTKEYAKGTSINRAAEYLDSTTTNIVELPGMVTDEKENDNGDGSYILSADDLTEADYVITVGFQGSNITEGSEAYETLLDDLKGSGTKVFAQLPDSTYGIYMNSVENALGQAIMIMGVYGDELKVDTNDAVAYFYSHFYHIKSDKIAELANKYFHAGQADCFGYSELNSDDTVSASIEAYENFLN